MYLNFPLCISFLRHLSIKLCAIYRIILRIRHKISNVDLKQMFYFHKILKMMYRFSHTIIVVLYQAKKYERLQKYMPYILVHVISGQNIQSLSKLCIDNVDFQHVNVCAITETIKLLSPFSVKHILKILLIIGT